MSRTIHVPEGDEGDEVVVRLLPSLWKMAQGKQNDRRAESEDGN